MCINTERGGAVGLANLHMKGGGGNSNHSTGFLAREYLRNHLGSCKTTGR